MSSGFAFRATHGLHCWARRRTAIQLSGAAKHRRGGPTPMQKVQTKRSSASTIQPQEVEVG